jgi:PhnB protein
VAFACYAKTFGTRVSGLTRFAEVPGAAPAGIPVSERNLVLHAELPILGGHMLTATDMLRSMGQETRIGNNTTLCLDAGSKDGAGRLYGALSGGGCRGRRWPACRGARTGASSWTGTASAG